MPELVTAYNGNVSAPVVGIFTSPLARVRANPLAVVTVLGPRNTVAEVCTSLDFSRKSA